MKALCCFLDGSFHGAYLADLYLRVAVGCESSVEHAQTASLRVLCDQNTSCFLQ
jgi:hypothetical protein